MLLNYFEFMFKIDQKAIELAEKFSQKFQRITGKTNFFISKALGFFVTMWQLVDLGLITPLSSEKPVSLTEMVIHISFGILLSLLTLFVWTWGIINYDESTIIKNINKGLSNWEKLHPEMISKRAGLLTGAFFLFGINLMVDLIIQHSFKSSSLHPIYLFGTIWLAYIFRACNPLPPQESKIRQTIKAIKAVLSPAQTSINQAFHSSE